MHPYDNAEALLRTLNAPRRNKYFYGKRMDVQHFQMEQDYGKLKQWLLNRLTLGKGVMCGLRLSVDGSRVCVDPGVAIDGLGREIVVPVRTCIDPVVTPDDCCGCGCGSASKPPAASAAQPPASMQNAGAAGVLPDSVFSLWLCYHECLTDRQAAMVSECGTRDECAAGTVVESFCLKMSHAVPPFQGDPQWCAKLWGTTATSDTQGNAGAAGAAGDNAGGGAAGGNAGAGAAAGNNPPGAPVAGANVPGDAAGNAPLQSALTAASASRRTLLCEAFDCGCDPAEADPCVPLGLVFVRDGEITLTSCEVRPRIYSNQKLLDLILCLAEKIDDCCGKHQANLLRVASVDFLHISDGAETTVANILSPLADTPVNIDGKTNAIRIKFNQALATDQHAPATHGSGDAQFEKRNVQVLPVHGDPAAPFVPGSLTIEASDTVRFDLFPDSPYARGADGWQKGQYQIRLRGTEDLAKDYQALASTDDVALDGEAKAPIAGVMSGDGNPGGDFVATFTVGGGAPPAKLLHVASIDFLYGRTTDTLKTVASVKSPLDKVVIKQFLSSIRIRFDAAFAQDAAHVPAAAGLNDPDFASWNVQVLLQNPDIAKKLETHYVPGKVVIETADTIRFDTIHGSTVINADGMWPNGLDVECRLLLRGTPYSANQRAEIDNQAGNALDGEPIAPAGGVMSGDGQAGGDFTLDFVVQKAG